MSLRMIDFDTDVEPAQSAQQEAYCHIRRQILSGVLQPGHRINLAEIAQSLSISRMPIRDALRQLDTEGLVVMRPNRGATVVDLTPDEAEEYFEIRAALEALSAGLAAPVLSKGDIDNLAVAKDRMNQVQNDQAQWIIQHRRFHSLIQHVSGRPNLTREIARVTDMLTPCIGTYLAENGFRIFSDYSHDVLFSALCSGDAAIAENATRSHVLLTGRDVVRTMRERGRRETGSVANLAV